MARNYVYSHTKTGTVRGGDVNREFDSVIYVFTFVKKRNSKWIVQRLGNIYVCTMNGGSSCCLLVSLVTTTYWN